MFQKFVMEDGIAEVTDISEKQESKSRPSGLNTVNLLKVRMQGVSILFFPQFGKICPYPILFIALFIIRFHKVSNSIYRLLFICSVCCLF